MSQKPPPGPPGPSKLMFSWEKPRSLLQWLPWFVFLSLLAHAGTFFLFSVVYPVRATLPPPVPSITVIDDSSPENIALLRWIEAEDPALIDAATNLQPKNLVTSQYRPSYMTARTRPRSWDRPKPVSRYKLEQDPFYIIASSERADQDTPPAQKPQKTTVRFSGNIPALKTPVTPKFQSASVPLDQAQFLIGITDRGEVRYSFLQHSCGDAQLDSDAARYLGELSFEPSKSPVSWGFATVIWGDDAYSK